MKQMYFLKRLGLLATALITFIGVDAASLTPEQALQRVAGHAIGRGMPRSANYQLSYTEKSEGENMLYVFNRGENGFVVTSADDRLPALLGYSDKGAFDIKKISPELKWWLGQYAGEATHFLKNEDKYTRSARTRSQREEIPVLLTTTWDQWEPYNMYCPESKGEQCVTGCVATAMAQVIKYHAYPVTGTGEHSYKWNNTELSFDYGGAAFDYANMIDNYYEVEPTEAQKEAVAQLMYACGVGVNMHYSYDGSSASDFLVANALQNYFNYSKSVRYLLRNCYTTQEWEDIIYAELEAKRPVIYGGQAPDGGHEFVCDGYKDGFFHINWGWSGYCDGYFTLSALNPEDQGIGGFEGGYNSDQDIICGISPDTEISSPVYSIYSSGGLSVIEVQYNIYAVIAIEDGFIGNYGADPVSVDFYMKVVSESGQEYFADEGFVCNFDSASEIGYVSGPYVFGLYLPTNLPKGNYKAYIGFKTPEGVWHDVVFPVTDSGYLDMTVDAEGTVKFTSGEPREKAKIQVTEFAPVTTVKPGEPALFDITVKNIGDVEYKGSMDIRVFKRGLSEQLDHTQFDISLSGGAELNGRISITYELEEGEYDAIFFDRYGDQVSEVFPLFIGVAPVVVTEIIMNQPEAIMTAEDTLQLSVTVLPEDAADKSVTWSSSNPEVANVSEDGLVTALNEGTAIITATSNMSEDVSAKCELTVKAKVIEVTGIYLNCDEDEIMEGETLILTATVEPETATDKSVIWISSDEDVATVNEGVVTALKPGKVTITAEASNGLKASCELTVVEKEPEIIYATSITLDRVVIGATVGEVVKLIATVLPEDATDKTVAWSSSDESVATVDSEGNVTIVNKGSAIITACTTDGSDLKAECVISGLSGITAVICEAGSADIYSVNGNLIKKNADANYFSTLVKGTYIILIEGRAYKVVK